MGDKGYTLDELVDRTGFGKRQIRYYITEKLVPGAGDQRGPNAVYPEETLRRLEAIAVFKDQPVGPTGRAMTLAEIGHALDNMPGPGMARMLCGLNSEGPDIENLDSKDLNSTSMVMREPESALDYLDNSVCEISSAYGLESGLAKPSCMRSSVGPRSRPPELGFPESPDEHSLQELLHNLKSLLTELGSDTRLNKQAGEGQSWQRLNSPDVEIQVRTPDTKEARRRLLKMAAQLGHLLEREE